MRHLYALIMLITSVGSVALAQQPLAEKRATSDPAAAKVRRVCVVGNVVKPSEITFADSLTVTQAIKEAGGILRNNKGTEVLVISAMIGDWRMRAIYVDLKKVKKEPFRDLELQDYDTLYVEPLPKLKKDDQTSNPCPSWPVLKNRL